MGDARSRARLEDLPKVVGIEGGLNGRANGAIVGSEGLIATTSYAVGSARKVTVTLDARRKLTGAVVRRYPTHDLAFIEAGLELARGRVASAAATLAAGSAFVALGYGGFRLRGALAEARGEGARRWLRTSLSLMRVPEAGGNPLYDESDRLLGILTRNVDGAGNVLAIPWAQVMALADGFARDRRLMPDCRYCPVCGALTRARLYGGAHCETCGASQPAEATEAALPPNLDKLATLYGDDAAGACAHCGARVEAYAGRCLRCGKAIGSDSVMEG